MSTPTTEEPFTIFHKFPQKSNSRFLDNAPKISPKSINLDLHQTCPKTTWTQTVYVGTATKAAKAPEEESWHMIPIFIATDGTTTRRDMLLATNAEPIRLNTLFVKSQGARNTVHVFRVLCSCDCAAGWGVESIVVRAISLQLGERATTEDACMEGKRSGKLQITIGLREKVCHMDIDGGEDGGRTMLITRHINQMPSRG
ncbi:hypothetical protein FCULG_00011026 [Fusarium culmorum]|uniref:Uncharacterized protein n=1 Tax=Fusarium culmorum TaxID=5516 RepID=A0A2T4GZS7_FUSCU|nr:hypothetical protein FCULG_00011026 [Fusarium culmorum]